METINVLLELFPYAILGSIAAGIICSFLGVFVVSQRVVFLGAALTQAAIAGVAFAFLHLINLEELIASVFGITVIEDSFLHHFEHTFFSLLFAVIAVLIFSQSYRQKFLTKDSLLGIIFVIAIAMRIIFIQKSPSAEVAEIESILKGDILFIGSAEFYTLLVILIIILLIFSLFSKQLKFVTFDADTAAAHGVNDRFWLLLFYLTVGIGISLTTRFVGDVFTFAFLILPASIAILISKKISQVFITAIFIGAIIPPLGIYFAFEFDISSGPTAVAAAFALFIIVYIYKKLLSD
ncbi:MAG: metal ABC transporter permease [Ignavibacteria bacterium]|nr:metal ABC transporter permease [Ignavibacteria bacterium]MBT8381371.1 metal ABC transporter permease [Ignavibacteria bacterium]MBT8390975.1 metal ABC transporter permease [Ignavibacteria bacterium]NNJ54383.1 metal ABC transporter permease [Ignavibacteriaceae bacterium]NNL21695.1 metal ABC transporter permease [Ignavibacteriaceae bacterium]